MLIFPGLHSGNLALHLLRYGATVEEVVNLVTVGAVEAASLKRTE